MRCFWFAGRLFIVVDIVVRLSELHDFFGAYFHQDWVTEYGAAEQVIDAFLADSDPEDLKLVQQELGFLLEQRKSERELKEYLLKELSCYTATGMSGNQAKHGCVILLKSWAAKFDGFADNGKRNFWARSSEVSFNFYRIP